MICCTFRADRSKGHDNLIRIGNSQIFEKLLTNLKLAERIELANPRMFLIENKMLPSLADPDLNRL